MSAPADPRSSPESDQLRGLTEVGRALTYATSLEQVAQLAVERGAALLGATAAVLMLADEDDLLHLRATFAIPPERAKAFGAPVSGDLGDRLRRLLHAAEDRIIAVPLVVGGGVTGLVAVALSTPPGAADEWLLSALADQAAVALERARLGGEVRLRMEDRLRASEGATNAKDRALSTLAHDIRTPLGAIEGYCQIMLDELYGPITEQQRESLGRIRMSGQHLLSLLDNVMDIARLNAGIAVVLTEPVPLAQVTREAVDMLTPTSGAKLQSLQLSTEGNVIVTADHTRLRQVLVNLLGNAVKFTPERGTITVETHTESTSGAAWGVVRVADTGPGIANAELQSIFEPYFRSESTSRLPGVGLGLAISYALIKEMSGDLAVESELGSGSAFTVRLPIFEAS